MDLLVLAKLQEKGIASCDKAVEELKGTNEELYFHTPRTRLL
jgi:transcription initiation factor IIE alpha subunit